MITSIPSWDLVVDVVVVGSGAAGLVAALSARDAGAEVVILEKSDLVGGTTAVSNGIVWVPLNSHMEEVAERDTRQDALAYVERLTLGREVDRGLLEVYIDTAAEVLAYLEASTPLRVSPPPALNDYYNHFAGGRSAGRSVEPQPFHAGAELGREAGRLRLSPHLGRLTTAEESAPLRGQPAPVAGTEEARMAADTRVLGAGLVAALFKGLLDRGVRTRTAARVTDLVSREGRVIGVHAVTEQGGLSVRARKGVVLACGGFEWSEDLLKAFIGRPLAPLSPPYNEGDGLLMAMEAGALLGNMTSFWGQPAIAEPGAIYEGHPLTQMGTARATPGVIVIDSRGRRFVNEGLSYQDFSRVTGDYDPIDVGYPRAGRQFLVFDYQVQQTMMLLPSLPPGTPAPAWVSRAATLGDLACCIGVEPAALEQTVREWNDHVTEGADPDFLRGTVDFETLLTGNPPSPHTCMRAITEPPFFAVPLVEGTLGTNGGPITDRHGRVRSARGGVIPGLYAAGNVSACIFGPAYPGGGATIGPAITFGFLAGRHAAGADETAASGRSSQDD